MNLLELFIILCFMTTPFIYLFTRCYFCKSKLNNTDRLSNGRVRYRVRDTNLPVCKCCAMQRRGEVE